MDLNIQSQSKRTQHVMEKKIVTGREGPGGKGVLSPLVIGGIFARRSQAVVQERLSKGLVCGTVKPVVLSRVVQVGFRARAHWQAADQAAFDAGWTGLFGVCIPDISGMGLCTPARTVLIRTPNRPPTSAVLALQDALMYLDSQIRVLLCVAFAN